MDSSDPVIDLRAPTPADALTLASWAEDATFCAHAGWRADLTLGEATDWWMKQIEAPDPALVRLLAVHRGEIVGYVDLHGAEVGVRELGYVVAPSSRWGAGIGTAAARAGLAHGFEVMQLDRIWAEAVAANESSVRILWRIEMREIGIGDSADFLGRRSHYVRFEMSRSDREPDPRPHC